MRFPPALWRYIVANIYRSVKHSGGTKHETTLLFNSSRASSEGSRAITNGDIPDRLRRHVMGTIPARNLDEARLSAREKRGRTKWLV